MEWSEGDCESTIVQTSADRLMTVEKSAKTWTGEMVVAVHVGLRNETSRIYRRFSNLHRRIEALGRCRLHIYFALELELDDLEESSNAYPVNALRNVALEKAKTDLVFLLDPDFVLNPGSVDSNSHTLCELY
ncbi:hypothetical protein R1flu_024081 [Riccia fluitans]|uniref:Glycosyltransferase family 92 protein n=1 Tax=Riccia fluitans TaxID=41844 RepID=A0ABD1XUB8_9MARC